MANSTSDGIIQQARKRVAECGGWEAVYSLYPSMTPAMVRGYPQVPCPFDGGHKNSTKFRLLKDWKTTGAGYHNDFGLIYGIDMVLRLEDVNNPGVAAKRIIEMLGGVTEATYHPVSTHMEQLSDEDIARRKAHVDRLIQKASPATGHWLYRNYCRERGLPMLPAQDLLIGRNVYYKTPEGEKSFMNALLGIMRKPDGEILTAHRIYLDAKGRGVKGPDGKRIKMMMPPPCQKGEVKGCAIRLAEPRLFRGLKTLAFSEGIETGLSVMSGVGLPVWACYSNTLLECVEVPKDLQKAVIFADYDYKGGAGLDSAEVLAERLRSKNIDTKIVLPLEPPGFNQEGAKGVDWLDVYQAGLQEFRRQVRESLLLGL